MSRPTVHTQQALHCARPSHLHTLHLCSCCRAGAMVPPRADGATQGREAAQGLQWGTRLGQPGPVPARPHVVPPQKLHNSHKSTGLGVRWPLTHCVML